MTDDLAFDISSVVTVALAGKGYIIRVTDQFTTTCLAVTKEELEQILSQGKKALTKTS